MDYECTLRLCFNESWTTFKFIYKDGNWLEVTGCFPCRRRPSTSTITCRCLMWVCFIWLVSQKQGRKRVYISTARTSDLWAVAKVCSQRQPQTPSPVLYLLMGWPGLEVWKGNQQSQNRQNRTTMKSISSSVSWWNPCQSWDRPSVDGNASSLQIFLSSLESMIFVWAHLDLLDLIHNVTRQCCN